MSFFEVVTIILNFAGALALFLFGMKLMSEGLQKVAGSKMRNTLDKITNNPFSGILTGTAVTAAIQSSSATTVMVVSFVNAGLLSLSGAVAVIMGANIGTTLTAWIITLFGLGESGGAFSLSLFLAACALLFLFAKKTRLKSIGESIIGLSLLLVGMGFLQTAMPDLSAYPDFLEFLGRLSHSGYLSILLFVVIGALLTCLIQASAAMMAITLVMCYNGWIEFPMAVALVMGQNIGTTITANLAAMVANSAGKKAARAHLVFNVIGVLITLVLFYPLMKVIDTSTMALIGHSPYLRPGMTGYSPGALPLALAIFHTFFNVVNTLILVWFIPVIIKIVNWMVKSPADEDEDDSKLTFIAGGFMNTAELNIQSAKKEIENFSRRVLRMYSFLPGLRTAKDEDEFTHIFERIEKYEGITDHMELEITKFLTKVSEGDLSKEGSQTISAMLRIIDNLESIGDAIYQLAMWRKTKRETAVHFDSTLNDNISHIDALVQKALQIMDANLQGDYSKVDLAAAYAAEDQINQYRDKLRARHLEDLRLGVYDYAIGSTYSGIYALYEKLGDYVINVSEAIDVNQSKKMLEFTEQNNGHTDSAGVERGEVKNIRV
ncbi:MAG: Na/Pi cotransporter family protein [Bacteroidales bacterium]|nr:Na/Pi cotransporter family protein [Bacteroidales bacterium]